MKMRKTVLWLVVVSVGMCVIQVRAEEQLKGGPSRTWTEEGTVKATVVSINQKTREITLKGPEGNTETVEAGKEVVNFNQIKKGDLVVVDYLVSTTISVRKPQKGESPQSEIEVEVETAAKGEKPFGSLAGKVEMTATVESINYKTREVKLKGPEGNVEVFQVSAEAKRFNEVKKGDIVVAQVTKSVAISVQKQK